MSMTGMCGEQIANRIATMISDLEQFYDQIPDRSARFNIEKAIEYLDEAQNDIINGDDE